MPSEHVRIAEGIPKKIDLRTETRLFDQQFERHGLLKSIAYVVTLIFKSLPILFNNIKHTLVAQCFLGTELSWSRSLSGLHWNQGRVPDLPLSLKCMCSATSDLRFLMAFLTALSCDSHSVGVLHVSFWLTVLKNCQVSHGTACSEHVNFQEVGKWGVLCFNNRNGRVAPSQCRNATIYPSTHLPFLLLEITSLISY
jgi:hypothetical protein